MKKGVVKVIRGREETIYLVVVLSLFVCETVLNRESKPMSPANQINSIDIPEFYEVF